jgi:hypothetical protein
MAKKRAVKLRKPTLQPDSDGISVRARETVKVYCFQCSHEANITVEPNVPTVESFEINFCPLCGSRQIEGN